MAGTLRKKASNQSEGSHQVQCKKVPLGSENEAREIRRDSVYTCKFVLAIQICMIMVGTQVTTTKGLLQVDLN